jgi:hypothetical protein
MKYEQIVNNLKNNERERSKQESVLKKENEELKTKLGQMKKNLD